MDTFLLIYLIVGVFVTIVTTWGINRILADPSLVEPDNYERIFRLSANTTQYITMLILTIAVWPVVIFLVFFGRN